MEFGGGERNGAREAGMASDWQRVSLEELANPGTQEKGKYESSVQKILKHKKHQEI